MLTNLVSRNNFLLIQFFSANFSFLSSRVMQDISMLGFTHLVFSKIKPRNLKKNKNEMVTACTQQSY